mmetsp:Transcript_11024/g.24450  ORF Transcript_11024/g.24450 Transcript_11024/m.24450 type:complete len:259 (-) Transcript_11024:960-1736(-)
MMSAENMRTCDSSAMALASASTVVSKASMVANSGRPFSFMMLARITSFLWMGPMFTCETGMGGLHSSRRNCSSASRAPSVDACTMTPLLSVCRDFCILATSPCTSSVTSSRSSPGCTSSTEVPASTRPMSGATIFTPMAPEMDSWCMYSDLMRISFEGGGVSSALMVVTTGPFMVLRTMVSPSLRVPLTSTTSTVWPSPSMTFTSSTLHCRCSTYMSLSVSLLCVSVTSIISRSGTPSPVTAEVGTRLTVLPRSVFSQ